MGFNRVHIEGTLADGAESWSTSFACSTSTDGGVSDPVELTQWADECMSELSAGTGWPGDLRSMLGIGSKITGVRIYYYSTPLSSAGAVGESTAAAITGSGSNALPLQSSLVFSLLSGSPGRSRRGRIYWPFLVGAIQQNGKINTSSVTLVARATSMAAALNALCDAGPLLNLQPVIVSKTLNATTPVVSVRVGNVVDTQRRRRDNLVEDFGSASI